MNWVDSIRSSVRTGATFSLGFPITPPDRVSRLGQKYYGPVVLVTDPLCYSATDMFAAGFQDHGIGSIIGVGGATGAGGANVWTHGLLQLLTEPMAEIEEVSPYRPLPRGADIRVAIRRTTRVKERSGAVLEDLGVTPEINYRMTREDVTGRNQGLIDTAIDELAKGIVHVIEAPIVRRHRDRGPTVAVATRNIDRVETTVNGRGLPSQRVRRDKAVVELDHKLVGTGPSVTMRFLGYRADELVAERVSGIDLD
jgi:hypothetical protein